MSATRPKGWNGALMKTRLLALVFSASLSAQPPNVRLPDEAAGLDGIVRTLIAAFDQADIVALGEWHGRIPRAFMLAGRNNRLITKRRLLSRGRTYPL